MTDGERWAREELDALRAARFSPRAVAAFLGASQRRSATVGRERPALARQARRWEAGGAGAWVVLAAAGREPFRRRWRGGLAWWAAVAVMLDWHLGMVETEAGRPRPLGAADALTLGRAWLVPVLADDLHPPAVLIAAATDLLDGMAARAAEPTRAGRDLEGLVDSAGFLAALASAARHGRLSRAAIALEGARLTTGVAYAFVVYFARSREPDPAVTRAARLTTPLRVAGLAAAGSGRRRAGDALVASGSVASLAVLARSLNRRSAERV